MVWRRTHHSEFKWLALSSLLIAFCTLTTGRLFADPAAPHAPAPAANPTTPAVKPAKDGELDVSIQGTRKDKMVVGKYDPPAAFNLEDIQNFPEERLYPVLNNPITFEEGRDFSNMMDSRDEKIIHPWLPEIPHTPFLSMKPVIDKPAKDWTFAVIDQGGAPVASQEGKGTPPSIFVWSGEDKNRDYLAVDTVYIPQLSTTDKEGYRHTYMGQPAQFAVLYYRDKSRTVVELSTKRIFVDKKTDLTKEANVFLDKVCDLIREYSRVPFGLQGFDTDTDLARAREKALQKYFSDKLLVPDTQISLLEPGSPEKRGQAIAVVFNGTPGGAQ